MHIARAAPVGSSCMSQQQHTYHVPYTLCHIPYAPPTPGDQGPPLVLVHGFGASAYHYRYNIPVLAQTHKVYAIDLLGFGFSDKPVIDYNTPQRNVWADEIVAFVQQVVLPECDGQKAVLAGNSLGGYNVLSAAAQAPDVIR